MIRFILALLMVAAFALPAWAKPEVSSAISPEGWRVHTIKFDSSTDDSEPFGFGPSCSARVTTYGGSNSVSLYQVPTGSTAASSGTLIGTFSAVSTAITTFSPGQALGRAVSAAGSDGTVMEVWCSNVASYGGGEGTNQVVDRDGDGSPDYYHFAATPGQTAEDVQAALDLLTDTGPKVFELSGVIDSSAMDESSDLTWDSTRLISIPAQTVFQCNPGARIYGPSLAFWRDRSNVTLHVANADGADGVTVRGCFIENTDLLEPFDTDPTDANSNDWQATPLFGGIHFQSCEGCLAEGNVVRGSPHSGYFMTRNSGSTFRGNTAYATGEAFNTSGTGDFTGTTLAATEPAGETSLDLTATLSNCAVNDWILVELDEADPLAKSGTSRNLYAAGWVEATGDPITIRRASRATGRNPGLPSQASAGNSVFCSEGDKHAFELYTEDDAAGADGVDYIATNNTVEFNRAELISNVAFQIRGVVADEDECEDGSEVTCWHEGTVIRGNIGTDVSNELVQVRGSRNAKITDNTGYRTGFVTFTAANQYCSEPFDDSQSAPGDAGQKECSKNTYLANNVVYDCRPNSGNNATVGGCVRFNGGHEGIIWEPSNLIDGTIEGVAYFIGGDSPGSEYHMSAANVAANCLIDSLNTGSGSPLSRPLYGSLRCKNSGLAYHDGTDSNAPAVSWRSQHTGKLTLDPFVVSGIVSSWMFIDPVGSYDIVAPDLYNVSIDGSWTGYSGTFATIADRDTADGGVECSPEWDGLTVIVQDAASGTDCTTGAGSTENWCRCDGPNSTWVDDSPITNRDGWAVFTSSGDSTNGGGVYGGTITNTLGNAVSFLNVSVLGGASDAMTIQNVTLAKGAEGMLTADAPRGIEEQSGAATNLHVSNVKFDGITDANRYVSLESGDFSSGSIVHDIDTPSGSCNTGALIVDTDNTAAGQTLYVCENSAWNGLD